MGTQKDSRGMKFENDSVARRVHDDMIIVLKLKSRMIRWSYGMRETTQGTKSYIHIFTYYFSTLPTYILQSIQYPTHVVHVVFLLKSYTFIYFFANNKFANCELYRYCS